MRRRLRRRPAPPTALAPKSTYGKPPGHQLGGLRVVPLGKTEDAWLRTENGIRPRSYRAGWVGTLYPSSAPAGALAAPGRSASPCFAAESARVGTLMSLPEGIATLGSGEVRGGTVSSESDIRVPEAKRGRVPCRNEDVRRPSRFHVTTRLTLTPNLKRNKRSG